MLKASIVGLEGTTKYLRELQKQTRFATAKALTQTAKLAAKAVAAEMEGRFDRPTPYAVRSFVLLKPATRDELTAIVGLRDRQSSKSRLPPSELLAHQFTGGNRVMSGFEQYLARQGLIGAGEHVVPGAGAKLNQYGNFSKGQLAQVMSQMRIGIDPGQYATKSGRSKRNQKRAGHIFWSRGNARDGHLPRGVWIDLGDEEGIRPLMIVVSGASYKQRIDAARVVQSVVDTEFPRLFDQALKDALK